MNTDTIIENRRRKTATERILLRLLRGSATTTELSKIALRFGARLHELRKAGYNIGKPVATKRAGVYRYSLGF